jgi:hypothetical protein
VGNPVVVVVVVVDRASLCGTTRRLNIDLFDLDAFLGIDFWV